MSTRGGLCVALIIVLRSSRMDPLNNKRDKPPIVDEFREETATAAPKFTLLPHPKIAFNPKNLPIPRNDPVS